MTQVGLFSAGQVAVIGLNDAEWRRRQGYCLAWLAPCGDGFWWFGEVKDSAELGAPFHHRWKNEIEISLEKDQKNIRTQIFYYPLYYRSAHLHITSSLSFPKGCAIVLYEL
jgi:hypothetical protein